MEDVQRTKLTVSIPTVELEDMRQRAARQGRTVTELLRRSVATHKLLFDDNHGCRVLIEHPDGTMERVILG